MTTKVNFEKKVKISCDAESFLASLAKQGMPDLPMWHVISSLELSRALSVSLQTIANWRIRGQGPLPEPKIDWRGNKRYYRLDFVLEWLTGRPAWEYHRDWLQKKYHNMENITKADTERSISKLYQTNFYPQKWKRKLKPCVPAFSFTKGEAI